MGKWKKAAALSVAAVMAGSLVAFTACGDGDNNNNGTGSATGSTKESTALLNNMLSQSFSTMGLEANVTMSNTVKTYAVDTETGTKGKLTETETENSSVTEQVKMNLKNGDADIVMQIRENRELTDGQVIFLRNWHTFAYDQVENGEVTTWDSKVTLEYAGNALQEITDAMEGDEDDGMNAVWAQYMMSAFLDPDAMTEQVSSNMHTATYTLTKLADSFNGLTIAGSTATIDLNKTVYNAVTAIKSALNGIDQNTTVGDFFKLAPVKNILMSVTELTSAAEIKASVDNMVNSSAEIKQMVAMMGIDLAKLFPTPAKNMSTYDYLLQVISSNELKNAINSVLGLIVAQGGPTITMPTTLDKMTLDFFFNLAGIKIADVKAAFNEYTKDITQTAFVLNIHNDSMDNVGSSGSKPVRYPELADTTINLSNAQIIYTLSNGKVTKQDVTANFSMTYEDISTYRSTLSESAITVAVNATMDYPAAEYRDLTDISNCTTRERTVRYTDGAELELNNLKEIGYTLTQKVTNGKIVGFVLTDPKGNQKNVTAGTPFTVSYNDNSIVLSIQYGTYYLDLNAEEINNTSVSGTIDSCSLGERGFTTNTVSGILQGKTGTFVPNND